MNIQSKIYSCGSYLPAEIINSNHFFEEMNLYKEFGIPNNFMSRIMGIDQWRYASTDNPSCLAAKAAEKAFDKTNDVDPAEIDAVIFCGIEKDQAEPATAHNVQEKLGLKAKHVFDVTNACFGFFDGIELADMLIATGRSKYVLVVTGETQRRINDAMFKRIKEGVTVEEVRNMMGFFSFGDAGGAMIIGRSENKESGFQFFNTDVDSTLNRQCFYKLNKGFEGQMLMKDIMVSGFEMQKSRIFENLNNAGWDKFDWLLTHQTGRKNYEETQKLGVTDGPEKVIKTFDKLGNVTSATLPVAFDQLVDLKKGDKIGGAFAGSGLIIGQFGYTV